MGHTKYYLDREKDQKIFDTTFNKTLNPKSDKEVINDLKKEIQTLKEKLKEYGQ
jgi:hypothetical protein